MQIQITVRGEHETLQIRDRRGDDSVGVHLKGAGGEVGEGRGDGGKGKGGKPHFGLLCLD